MSIALAAPFVYRRAVVFCVLPAELAGLHDGLRRAVAGLPDVRVVVERRAGEGVDRRVAAGGAGAVSDGAGAAVAPGEAGAGVTAGGVGAASGVAPRDVGAAAAPGGVERRQGERRAPDAAAVSLADLGVRLPWQLRRHATRIACVQRMLPVHRADAEAAAFSLLLDATGGDATAQHELRLRYHEEVHGFVRAGSGVARRKAAATTEAVFDDLFAQQSPPPFRVALADAYVRVLTP